jgi:hypothetical protein
MIIRLVPTYGPTCLGPSCSWAELSVGRVVRHSAQYESFKNIQQILLYRYVFIKTLRKFNRIYRTSTTLWSTLIILRLRKRGLVGRMLRQLGPYYCFIILFNIYMCIIIDLFLKDNYYLLVKMNYLLNDNIKCTYGPTCPRAELSAF